MSKKNNSRDILGGEGGEAVEKPLARGNKFLVAIAINAYPNFRKLTNAVKDAEDFIQIMQEQYGYAKAKVYKLFDKDATRGNIYQTLTKLTGEVKDIDNMIVYFSGHGYYDELLKLGYWIPYDALPQHSDTYLENTSLTNFIRVINSRHTLIVADACFSGALFATRSTGMYADKVEQKKSRWAFASGRLEEVSDGAPGENSPFAGYLIKFLRTNQNPKMTVSELVHDVKMAVGNNVKQTPEGSPLFGVGDEGGEMVFYLKGHENLELEVNKEIEKTQAGEPKRSIAVEAPISVNPEPASLADQCRDKIAEGKTGDAINLLIKNLPAGHSLKNSIILISGSWKKLSNDVLMGIITSDDQDRETSKINNRLLMMLDQI